MRRSKYKKERSMIRLFKIFLVAAFFILSGYSLDYADKDISNGFFLVNRTIAKYAEIYKKEFKLDKLSIDQIEDVVFSMIKWESNFDAKSRSWEESLQCFSYGLLRLVPDTARDMGWHGKYNRELYDVDTNIKYGMRYLCAKLKKYNQNIQEAVVAYNAGGVYTNKENKLINQRYLDMVYFNFYLQLRQGRKTYKIKEA